MSIKQRLYPDDGVVAQLHAHVRDARFVFNLGLEQRAMWSEQRRYYAQKVNVASQMRELAEARQATDWLRAGSSVVQQGALRDLDRAFQNFFAGHASYPTWRKMSDPKQSFVIRDLSVKRLNRKWGAVLVPKVGFVKFRLTRDWTAVQAATSARVMLHHGQWHVSFTTPPPPKLNPGTGEMVGIDRGVANSIATSEGDFHHAPSLTPGEQRRFVALQRRLTRQQKGSTRRETTKAQLGKLRTRLNNRRTHWVEHTTTSLARRYDLVVIEDLNTKGMTRKPAPKPDPDQPGVFLPNGARAKAGLNRAILASQWGRIETRLTHKTHVEKVSPRNTSRECSNPQCRHIAETNRKSQAEFICEKCGHAEHADVNAAKNILERYLNQPQPEDIGGSGVSVSETSRANHLEAA